MDLFEQSSHEWPAAKHFPLNVRSGNRSVEAQIADDFQASLQYDIVTGFTSLEYLVAFFQRYPPTPGQRIRVALGNEPLVEPRRPRPKWRTRLNRTLCDYWLAKGFSPRLSGAVISVIELIRREQLCVYILDDLHAKMYLSESHAVLGSSNFSHAGLRVSLEANIRHEAGTESYAGMRQIADSIFTQAQPFSAELIALLMQLLQDVPWQDALARAVIELLEGEWMKDYEPVAEALRRAPLWPSQKEAIAQALYILDRQGSVLVADPTGSGKTKLGVNLLQSIYHRLWATGRGHRSQFAIICPPQVIPNWTQEARASRSPQGSPISHGILSRIDDDKHDEVRERIRDSNILVIDEAHNYLSSGTNRSKTLLDSNADHVMLLTATPINRLAIRRIW